MDPVFGAARATFGGAFCNRGGRTRKLTETAMRRYCQCQRHRYGPCTRKRSQACQEILRVAVAGARGAERPHAMLTHLLVKAVNDERTHEQMKATIPKPSVARLPDLDFEFDSPTERLAA